MPPTPPEPATSSSRSTSSIGCSSTYLQTRVREPTRDCLGLPDARAPDPAPRERRCARRDRGVSARAVRPRSSTIARAAGARSAAQPRRRRAPRAVSHDLALRVDAEPAERRTRRGCCSGSSRARSSGCARCSCSDLQQLAARPRARALRVRGPRLALERAPDRHAARDRASSSRSIALQPGLPRDWPARRASRV